MSTVNINSTFNTASIVESPVKTISVIVPETASITLIEQGPRGAQGPQGASSPASSLLQASSTTSNYIAPSGQKTFNIGTGKSFITGVLVTAMKSTDMLNTWMHGTVVSYSGSSLTLQVDSYLGSGTHSGWYIVADILIDPVFFGRPRITSNFVPASASASGTKGDMAWDADYYYRCVATNTWKRVLMTTW